MAKTSAERMREYRKRLKEMGITTVTVEVPVDRMEELRQIAAKMIDEHNI